MSYFFSNAFKSALTATPTLMTGAKLHMVLFAHAPDDMGANSKWATATTLANLLAMPGWFEVGGIDGYPLTHLTPPSSVRRLPNVAGGNQYVLWSDFPLVGLSGPVTVEAIGLFLVAGASPAAGDMLVMVTDSFIKGSTNLYPGDLIRANPDQGLAPPVGDTDQWIFSWVDGVSPIDPVEGALSVYRDAPPYEVSNTQHVWLYPNRVNMVANPSFEGKNTNFWAANGTKTVVAAQKDPTGAVPAPAPLPGEGVWAMSTPGVSSMCIFESNVFPTQLGGRNAEQWTIQLRARGTGQCKVGLIYWDASANATLSAWGDETWTLNPDTWLHLAVHRTAPEAHLATVRIECMGTLLEVDRVLAERGYLKDWWYFDGDELYGARDDFSWYGGAQRQSASYSLWYNHRRAVVGRLFAQDAGSANQTVDSIFIPDVPAVGGYINSPAGSASTADDPTLTITTNIVITAKVRKNLINNPTRTALANHMGASGTDSAWEFYVVGGEMYFHPSITGSGFTAIPSIGDLRPLIGNGQDFYVGAALTLNTGGAHGVTGLFSLDGVIWQTLVGTGAAGVIASVFNSTASVRVGVEATSTAAWDGRIYWVEMRQGIVPNTGTRMFRFDGDNWTSGTSFSSAGRTWTVTSAGAMSARVPGVPGHYVPGTQPIVVDTDIEAAGLAYRWVPAGVSVVPHMDVLYPNDLQSPIPPKTTITPYSFDGGLDGGVINPWGTPTGFSIVLTESGAPHGYNFGTSEISGHTTNWNFGDGFTGSCPSVDTLTHVYQSAGTYEVSATCHGVTETITVDTADPLVTGVMLDSIEPFSLPIGGQVTVTLHGSGFAEPMLARFWDVSTYMTDGPCTVIDANTATVDIFTTDWPEGTGGVDCVVGDQFSNQLQFPVTNG